MYILEAAWLPTECIPKIGKIPLEVVQTAAESLAISRYFMLAHCV